MGADELSYIKYLLGPPTVIIIIFFTITIVTVVEVGRKAILEGTQWSQAVPFYPACTLPESFLSFLAGCPDPQDSGNTEGLIDTRGAI